MSGQPLITLEQASALVELLESGKVADANRIAGQMIRRVDRNIYQQVGRLTRQLHDSVEQFRNELGASGVSGREFSDIRTRLHHAVDLMERAAHESLAAVEESDPLAKEIVDGADKIADGWDRFRNREMDLEQFRELSDEIAEFMSMAAVNSEKIHARLNRVMMAQGFQDLTGQIIHRVVDVIGSVEESLVELIRLSDMDEDRAEVVERERKVHGPAIPSLGSGAVVRSQDEVDELLSSLGF